MQSCKPDTVDLKHIERLSPKSKQQLLNIIDTFIEAETLKQRSSR